MHRVQRQSNFEEREKKKETIEMFSGVARNAAQTSQIRGLCKPRPEECWGAEGSTKSFRKHEARESRVAMSGARIMQARARPQRYLLRPNHRLALFSAGVICSCTRLCTGHCFPEVLQSCPSPHRPRHFSAFMATWPAAFQSLSEESRSGLKSTADRLGLRSGKRRKLPDASPHSLLPGSRQPVQSTSAMAMSSTGGVKSDTDGGKQQSTTTTEETTTWQEAEAGIVAEELPPNLAAWVDRLPHDLVDSIDLIEQEGGGVVWLVRLCFTLKAAALTLLLIMCAANRSADASGTVCLGCSPGR